MTTRWTAVADWLEALRERPRPRLDLSPEGARLACDVALDALSPPVLARVAAMDVVPFERARFVAARTVCTAPLEWMAVLLGRGTAVELQVPSAPSDTGRLWADWGASARALGLPLVVGTRGEGMARSDAPLVVVMGGDDTIRELVGGVPVGARYLGFGARYSVAVCENPADAEAVARDLVLHDGRGCMSPGLVLAHDEGVADALAQALAAAEARWPRGRLSDAEHAAIRSRGALAQVSGRAVHGEAWAVHVLPWSRRRVESLPRAPLVVVPPDLDEALAQFAADPHLSTLGTSRPLTPTAGGRIVPVGCQQRPPVERHHDGVDWLRVAANPGDPLASGDTVGRGGLAPKEAT